MSVSNEVSDDSIRILLRVDNRLLRETLVRLFHKRSDFFLLERLSTTPSTAVRDVDQQCDVCVMDHLPSEFLRAADSDDAKQPLPALPSVVLIGMEDNEEQFFSAIRSGISSYLLKDASAEEVIAAARAATHGEAICPPRLCLALFRLMARITLNQPSQNWKRPKAQLTIRQQRLIALVAKGLTNKEIALHLNLSEYTVRNSIHRIMRQVDARSRGEAVQAIRAHGYAISP